MYDVNTPSTDHNMHDKRYYEERSVGQNPIVGQKSKGMFFFFLYFWVVKVVK